MPVRYKTPEKGFSCTDDTQIHNLSKHNGFNESERDTTPENIPEWECVDCGMKVWKGDGELGNSKSGEVLDSQ